MSDPTQALSVDAETLAVLRCPLTRSKLRREGDVLIAEVGGLRYPIRDGFPVLLVEEATLPVGIGSIDEFRKKYADLIAR